MSLIIPLEGEIPQEVRQLIPGLDAHDVKPMEWGQASGGTRSTQSMLDEIKVMRGHLVRLDESSGRTIGLGYVNRMLGLVKDYVEAGGEVHGGRRVVSDVTPDRETILMVPDVSGLERFRVVKDTKSGAVLQVTFTDENLRKTGIKDPEDGELVNRDALIPGERMVFSHRNLMRADVSHAVKTAREYIDRLGERISSHTVIFPKGVFEIDGVDLDYDLYRFGRGTRRRDEVLWKGHICLQKERLPDLACVVANHLVDGNYCMKYVVNPYEGIQDARNPHLVIYADTRDELMKALNKIYADPRFKTLEDEVAYPGESGLRLGSHQFYSSRSITFQRGFVEDAIARGEMGLRRRGGVA